MRLCVFEGDTNHLESLNSRIESEKMKKARRKIENDELKRHLNT